MLSVWGRDTHQLPHSRWFPGDQAQVQPQLRQEEIAQSTSPVWEPAMEPPPSQFPHLRPEVCKR